MHVPQLCKYTKYRRNIRGNFSHDPPCECWSNTSLAGSLPCSTYFVLIITLPEEYIIFKITFPFEVLTIWCIGVLLLYMRAFHIETILYTCLLKTTDLLHSVRNTSSVLHLIFSESVPCSRIKHNAQIWKFVLNCWNTIGYWLHPTTLDDLRWCMYGHLYCNNPNEWPMKYMESETRKTKWDELHRCLGTLQFRSYYPPTCYRWATRSVFWPFVLDQLQPLIEPAHSKTWPYSQLADLKKRLIKSKGHNREDMQADDYQTIPCIFIMGSSTLC